MYDSFVKGVDAMDNGINQYNVKIEPNYKINTSLEHRISRLNPGWVEKQVDVTERFNQAMGIADEEFIMQLKGLVLGWLPGRPIVEEAIQTRESVYQSGEIIKLKQFCPWKSHLYDIEDANHITGIIKFVIFQGNAEWRVNYFIYFR